MITKFQQFVNEALLPSQFRKYVKAFDRERYEKVFQELKAKYDGDRNAYRIYVPLMVERTITPLEKKIEAFFKDNNLEIVDYEAGECKFVGAKNTSKISKILNRMNKDLFDKYVIERAKKGGTVNDDLLVCISRHPYDIAGSDTDRDWTDCMTMKSKAKSPRILKIKEEIKDIEKKLKEITGQKVGKGDYGRYNMLYQYARQQSFEEKEKIIKLTNKISQLEEELGDRKEQGMNVHYLIEEVKQGSLMSYLIKKTDKNINNPLTVLNIKPYHNKKNETILGTSDSMYGKQNPEFKKTVDAILKEINGDAKGVFHLNQHVYHDNEPRMIMSDIFELDSNELENYMKINMYYSSIVDFIKDDRYDHKNYNFSMIRKLMEKSYNNEKDLIPNIQLLLDKGEDINKGDKNDGILTVAFYRTSSIELVKFLFKNGYKIKTGDNDTLFGRLERMPKTILNHILKNSDVNKLTYPTFNYYDGQKYRRLQDVSLLDYAIIRVCSGQLKLTKSCDLVETLCKAKCIFNNYDLMGLDNKLKAHFPEVIEILKKYDKI